MRALGTLVGAAALVTSLGLGCGRVGFEPGASNDADPATVVDADPATVVDAGPATATDSGSIDAAPVFAEPVRIRGVESCQGDIVTVAIAGATIATGTVLVVHAIQSFNTNGISVVDSKGNTYQLLETQGQLGQRMHVLQATITAPLVDGDSIAVTFERSSDNAVVVTEVIDVDAVPFSTQSAFAADESIVIDYLAPATGTMLCVGGIRGGAVVMQEPWNELVNSAEDCGGGQAGQTTFAYWAPAGQNDTDSCQAALVPGEGASKWAGAVIGFEP